jgi:hypothetical protein
MDNQVTASSTSADLHARHTELQQRFRLLETELLRLAGPVNDAGLAWFTPTTEPVRERQLPW